MWNADFPDTNKYIFSPLSSFRASSTNSLCRILEGETRAGVEVEGLRSLLAAVGDTWLRRLTISRNTRRGEIRFGTLFSL